jgi:N-acylglucosamine-6-phosphate 2-epimerase
MSDNFFKQTKGGLIVSCQALENEPLHSSYIMARMAYAAKLGGACGIRANSVEDIKAIKKEVDLPIIGIIKRIYPGCEVFITPTMKEVDELVDCGVDVIAIDATQRPRPDGKTLQTAFREIREKYPHQLFMADCSTYEEAVCAKNYGFDIVGTTLCGYTSYTKGTVLPNMELIEKLGKTIGIPVIAEGGIWNPGDLKKIIGMEGVHAAVIGSAITRPMEITKRFIKAIQTQ